MKKILWVANREFMATVATKGFLIGLLITPAVIGLMIVLFPILFTEKPPDVEGELAILDLTGEVEEGVRAYLAPEAIAGRWEELKERVEEETPDELKMLAEASGSGDVTQQAMEAAFGNVPDIRIVSLPAGVELEAEKRLLLKGTVEEGGRLAVAVVHEDAVEKVAGVEDYGTYDLFVRAKLDDRLEDEFKGALRRSIVQARVRARGLDPEEINALIHIGRVRSTTVTEKGEQATNEVFNMLVPAGFMILLLVSVLTGGQYIMTTTIEEKSSRVVEVLLSAVSPRELMTGKIIGQMCVGFVILALYAGMGLTGLFTFALMGMVDLSLFFYLILFYLIAYFVMGSLMAAIGAAVNEMREAQTLMTPVMVTMMLPWIFWLPISRDPNSMFATITSFIPPLNTFVILIRMSSTTPPPLWQVWLSIFIGFASVWAAIWFAAKVFRIGLLMHGKPPNFATLVRWVRMA